MFLDARSPDLYQLGHILCARSLPWETVEAQYGTAMEGVRVCASKFEESYAVAATSNQGRAFLPLTLKTTGSLVLAISGRNLATTFRVLEVLPVGTAHPRLVEVVVDDDAEGASFGNADGHVDAGEVVELFPKVENAGAASLSGLVLFLEVSSNSARRNSASNAYTASISGRSGDPENSTAKCRSEPGAGDPRWRDCRCRRRHDWCSDLRGWQGGLHRR